MAFYLEPPRGLISLRNLEKFAEIRLLYMSEVLEKMRRNLESDFEFDSVCCLRRFSDSECLIEGTDKDRISHFILRLAMSRDHDSADFLLKAETILFKLRIASLSLDELTRFLKQTYSSLNKFFTRSQKKSTVSSVFVKTYKIVLSIKGEMKSWRKVAKLYLSKSEDLCFILPFSAVPDLVAKRKVVIENGMALVPYSYLVQVLVACFQQTLQCGIKTAASTEQGEDIRIRQLSKKIQNTLRKKYKPEFAEHLGSNITGDDIQREATRFPPCMDALQNTLQKQHRLRHHSRIQYTLFLKEIGMPVHEALQFWRKEYSTTPDQQDGCTHDWQSNERRYSYNIRHLYGLEGSRINYSGHCCSSLQNFIPTCGESGGCPFKHFDQQNMQRFLGNRDVPDIEETVKDLCGKGHYSAACEVYLKQRSAVFRKSKRTRLGNCKYQNKADDLPLKMRKVVSENQSGSSCTDHFTESAELSQRCENEANSSVVHDGKTCISYRHQLNSNIQKSLCTHRESVKAKEVECVNDGESGGKMLNHINGSRKNPVTELTQPCAHTSSKRGMQSTANLDTEPKSLSIQDKSRPCRKLSCEKSLCDHDHKAMVNVAFESEQHLHETSNLNSMFKQSSRPCGTPLKCIKEQKCQENVNKSSSIIGDCANCIKVVDPGKTTKYDDYVGLVDPEIKNKCYDFIGLEDRENIHNSLELHCYDHTVCLSQVKPPQKYTKMNPCEQQRDITVSLSSPFVQISKPRDFYFSLKFMSQNYK